MYENQRDSFGRRYRAEDDRQRPYGRSWREPGWAGDRFGSDDDDRTDWRSERGGYRSSGYQGFTPGRDEAAAHRDHDEGHFRATYDRQGDNRQQSYFTGQQNSWAVPPAPSYGTYGGSNYGAYGASSGYGRDYRERGYSGGSDYDRNERGFFAKAGDEVASWFGDEDAARRREADHRGRGPKDYVRSDERIRDDVNDRLTEDRRVDASNITVTVEKGEVTLNGTVTERAAKRRAEDIVEDISGVKHVQNNLRVAETASTTSGAYQDNWALNQQSTAEGGTQGKDTTAARH